MPEESTVKITSIIGKPQCEPKSAGFPSIFQNNNARIVNGFDTKRPLPYQLMLAKKKWNTNLDKYVENGFFCGATLINLKYATSAFHCFDPEDSRKYLDEVAGQIFL